MVNYQSLQQIYTRLSRLENLVNSLKSEHKDVLWAAYQEAVSANDTEQAAYFLRLYRNVLIAETDNRALTDRTLDEEWRDYRQALRDITEQDGFPLSVELPVAPDAEVENDTAE